MLHIETNLFERRVREKKASHFYSSRKYYTHMHYMNKLIKLII